MVLSPTSTVALRGAPVAVFDFETTGPDPRTALPVQVAVVHCDLGDTEPEVVYKALIDPGIPIPEGARAVHGLSDEDVKGHPGWPEALDALLPWFEGRVLGAFNLPYDWQILARGMAAAGRSRDELPFGVLDPLVWAKVVQRYEKGKKLVDVAQRYGFEVDAHDAAGDALATARIMPKLLHDLGRHPEGGREPLLSVAAIQAWTVRKGIEADDGYARWRERKGLEPPTMYWRELSEGWWPEAP